MCYFEMWVDHLWSSWNIFYFNYCWFEVWTCHKGWSHYLMSWLVDYRLWFLFGSHILWNVHQVCYHVNCEFILLETWWNISYFYNYLFFVHLFHLFMGCICLGLKHEVSLCKLFLTNISTWLCWICLNVSGFYTWYLFLKIFLTNVLILITFIFLLLEPHHASTIPRIIKKTPPPVEINLKLIYDVKEIFNSQISHCEL